MQAPVVALLFLSTETSNYYIYVGSLAIILYGYEGICPHKRNHAAYTAESHGPQFTYMRELVPISYGGHGTDTQVMMCVIKKTCILTWDRPQRWTTWYDLQHKYKSFLSTGNAKLQHMHKHME